MKSNKFWLVTLGVMMIISVALMLMLMLRQIHAGTANIYRDGALIDSIDLSAATEPYSITVESASGVNVISVEHGRVCVSDSDCPDKLCVRQGWLSDGSIPIVCLPHRLVITLEGGGTPYVDAIVG